MNYRIHLDLMVDMVCPDEMTLEEAEKLAQLHVQNCIMDNPDADDSEVTNADVTIKR